MQDPQPQVTSRALSVLTPYLFPPGGKKVPNLGDEFILRAIERRIGPFPPERRFSSRYQPSEVQKQALLQSGGIILAGANQLDDNFAPWPALQPDEIRARPYIFVPMGIGIHGEPARNSEMSPAARETIAIIHERIRYSSWRCPRTVAYLRRSIPGLTSQFLMTGCPVLYDKPLLESSRFQIGKDIVAVTTTERGAFWDRESQTIDFVARKFPHAQKWLVVHQDYALKRKTWFAENVLGTFRKTADALQAYATHRGFRVLKPAGIDEGLAYYKAADLHFGSRLHAHLNMLSQNKRSFLTKVDERSTGISEHFEFPLCDPTKFEDVMDFDFERIRQAALRTFPVMLKFVESIGKW
ncbi:MAG: polysaccharide pyruvyl transferase family protein [Rhizobiales bacterium]|nr:polysaccharide pyruvyl transferase family protein [Hyphomicrobiales bacterium]MBI3673485.1 polysaccharide pyruvyl transferase family protein [Hyphomicrobiales bacterium]